MLRMAPANTWWFVKGDFLTRSTRFFIHLYADMSRFSYLYYIAYLKKIDIDDKL